MDNTQTAAPVNVSDVTDVTNFTNVTAMDHGNEPRNGDSIQAFTDAMANADVLSGNETDDVAYVAGGDVYPESDVVMFDVGNVIPGNETGDVNFDDPGLAYEDSPYGSYGGYGYWDYNGVYANYSGNATFDYGNYEFEDIDFESMDRFENTCAYVLLSVIIVGVLGNVMTFVVFHKGKVCGSSWCSLYFKILACADIYVLLSSGIRRVLLSLRGLDLFQLHDVLCKFGWFNYYLCVQISTWTTVAITIDRTISVRFPLKFQKMSTSRWIWAKFAGIVAVFVVSNFAVLVLAKIETMEFKYETFVSCDYPIPSPYDLVSYGVMVFFTPAVINVVCNVILLQALYKRASNSNLTEANVTSRRNLANYVTYRVVAIGVVHFLSTLPKTVDQSIQTIMLMTGNYLDQETAFYLFTISELFFYLNSGLNFILYCITGMDFRKDLKALVYKTGPPSRADMTSEL